MYRVNQLPPPPPRSGGTSWVVVVALVAAGLGLAAAATSTVLALRWRKEAKEASRAAGTASAASEPESPSAPAGAAAPAPDPDPDREPSEPGTPQASLRARPSWARLEVLSPHARKPSQYAPQPTKPLEVFLAAAPLSGDVARGFVICRFQSFNKADTFAGDDLHARVTLGKTPEVAADGPEDGNLAFVSAPLATLKKGDAVRFETYDRDVFGLSPITASTVTYGGQGLATADHGAAVECRVLAGESLSGALASRLSAADMAVTKITRRALDGSGPDWGWPHAELLDAQRSTGDAAALVGWDDPRTRKRVERVDAAVAALEAQRPKVFGELYAKAADSGSAEDLSVRLLEASCGAGGTCAPRVALRNDGKRPLSVGEHSIGVSAYVATSSTGPVRARIAGGDPDLLSIAPGQTVEVTVTASAPVTGDRALLGVCGWTRCAVLRLR